MWKAGAHLNLDWPFCWGISYTEIMSACQWAQTCRVLTLLLSIIIAYYYFHSELPTSLGDMKRKFMFPKDFRMKVKKSESGSVKSDSLQPRGLYTPWNFPGQNTGVGSLSLLQGIFPTQGLNLGGFFTSWATKEAQEDWVGSLYLLQWIFLTQELNRGLLHCRQILYQLSYQGSPKYPHRHYQFDFSHLRHKNLCVCSVAQLYLTLSCNPMDYSPPGTSAHGIFQARILERVAISFFRGFS